MKQEQKFRYIESGIVKGEDKLSDYRLIAADEVNPEYNGKVVIRVHIPEDVILTKEDIDPYYLTEDNRTLNQLGYDILILDIKKLEWEVHNEYKGIRPCDIYLVKFPLGELIGYTNDDCVSCGRMRVEKYECGALICEKCNVNQVTKQYDPRADENNF